MARNYLITQVSLHTFQRAHVIAKIYPGSKVVMKDGEEFVEVIVKKHKTSSTVRIKIIIVFALVFYVRNIYQILFQP